jgi:predicted methyltransferase
MMRYEKIKHIEERRIPMKSTLLMAMLFVCAQSAAESSADLSNKIKAAMQMDYRTEAELARDANRAPIEALAFMGLKDDMKVVEFVPSRQAWYTKILAPALVQKGDLYVVDSQSTFESWGDLLKNPVFKNTHKIPIDLSYNREEKRYDLGELNLGVNDADLFLHIREYHNFNADDKARMNQTAFDTLRSGGRYVLIDHTRRHMQPEDPPLARREDPVQVITDVQAAGFVLEKTSDMFYRPVDTLDKEVREFSGRTDRFFFVFKKP